MGLDASVLCECWRLGRTTEPPVPREWLEVDAEGYLELRPEARSDAAWSAFVAWKQACCEHPNLDRVNESIANWAGYRLFRQALADAGPGRFPTLDAILPEVNGGLAEASLAALALAELEEFRAIGEVGSNACLVATATGEVLHEHVAGYEGIFSMYGRSGLDLGFDAAGFFIRGREDGTDRFRAARFRQAILEPDDDEYGPEPGRVVYRDLDTGATFECRAAVHGGPIPWPDGRLQDDRGRVRSDRPAGLHVEVRPVRSTDFDAVVDPLAKVFRASVATGNPVRWC